MSLRAIPCIRGRGVKKIGQNVSSTFLEPMIFSSFFGGHINISFYLNLKKMEHSFFRHADNTEELRNRSKDSLSDVMIDLQNN